MKQALIVLLAPAALALALAGCVEQGKQDVPTREQAGQPMDPVKLAARMALVRVAAVTGDQAGVERQMSGMQEDLRKSMKLADPARRIDPERARAAVRTVQGVHSVAWIDRDNLLAMVEHVDLRSQGTIDTICDALQPLGDTLGVIVNLKARAPRNRIERETLSRNCQLPHGQVAMFQKVHPTYDPAPEVVSSFEAAQHPPNRADAARRKAAMRIIEASTPEM